LLSLKKPDEIEIEKVKNDGCFCNIDEKVWSKVTDVFPFT
jgi:hypothetical protein